MATNRELIRKADIALSDLTTVSGGVGGGYLNPEQSDAFIRKLLVAPTLLAQTRRVTMSAPVRKINKISFASRILQAAPSDANSIGAYLPTGLIRSKPTTEQITLTTSEVIAMVNLPYDVIEDNIERGNLGNYQEGGSPNVSGGLRDTIMTLIAERVAIDLEELAIKGNTGSSDTFLALQNGYLALLAGNSGVVDAGGAPVSRSLFKAGMKTLPSQYRRNRAAMAHFVSTENEIEYRDTLANRETALGDANLQSTAPVFASGSPVQGVALMPANMGFLTNPLNLIFGVQRDIMLETDKNIVGRQYVIVVTARIAIAVEETNAAVLYQNVAA